MGYTAVKEYGRWINVMATRFSECDNVFDGACSFLDLSEIHYIFSRLACHDLFANGIYPRNQKVVTFLYDTFVFSDVVKKVFLSKPYSNQDLEIDFIKRDIDDAYRLLCHAQELLMAITITAYPDRFEESRVEEAISVINSVNAKTNENAAKFNFAFTKLEAKEARNKAIEKAEAAKLEQNGKIAKPAESNPQRTEPVLYEIKDYQQCISLYEYLQKTKVLDDRTTLTAFLEAIVQADMSRITPNLLTKFRCAVARTKWAIKGDVDEWSRIACGSIGMTPSQALSGASNNGAWYEDLCKILPEYPIKK